MERAAQIVEANVGTATRPSIFELVAQDSLMSSLRPALTFLARMLAMNEPRSFSQLYKWYDEIHTALELLLQHHFLGKWGASFSEQFYGLQRVLTATGQVVHGTAKLKSLVLLVVFPYIRLKLSRLHDLLKRREQEGRRYPNPKLQAVCEIFLKLYPVLCGILELWALVMQGAYLVGRNNSHSPLLWLAGVTLRHFEVPESMGPDPDQQRNIVLRILSRLSSGLFHGLSRMLGVTLFVLQFLDWWYTEKANVPTAHRPVRVPPPPQRLLNQAEVVKMDPKMCPLCKKERRNHTVLTVSGFAFCYPCIHHYVEEHGRCPVTGVPATKAQLMRLYLEPSVLNGS